MAAQTAQDVQEQTDRQIAAHRAWLEQAIEETKEKRKRERKAARAKMERERIEYEKELAQQEADHLKWVKDRRMVVTAQLERERAEDLKKAERYRQMSSLAGRWTCPMCLGDGCVVCSGRSRSTTPNDGIRSRDRRFGVSYPEGITCRS